ncbi:MAG: DUF1553 domain-containing protein, partial [Akkermansiaceae bacterium]|nr:DUF1553 domain-containing protein [Akkermansiaceae bacterium]
LLNDPRHGERWARHWMDVWRYSDWWGLGQQLRYSQKHIWHWRDWIIESLNNDAPYDEMVRLMIAGDELHPGDLDKIRATGYLARNFTLFNRPQWMDATVEHVGKGLLGLTFNCARCHDHKYDPITQKDYYQLIAFFNNVPEAGRAIKAGNSEPYILAPTREQQAELAKRDAAVAKARAAMESDAVAARRRAWEQEVATGAATINTGLVQRGLRQVFTLDALPPDASATSGTVQFTDGVFGKALRFDGATVVRVPNHPPGAKPDAEEKKERKKQARFPALRASDAYSFSFWMRPEAAGRGVVLARQSRDMDRKGAAVRFRDGHLQFHVISRWIAGAGVIETVDKIDPGKWVHVAVTCDGTQRATGQFIYVDGRRMPVRIIHNTNSNVGGTPDREPLTIGGGHFDGKFTGAIDEVRVYTRALRPEEVYALSEPVFVREIAKRPVAGRTGRQGAKLRAWFFEHGPGKPEYDAFVKARAARDAYARKLPTTMVMAENPTPRETFIRKRGVYNDLGERVGRGVPEQLPPMADGLPDNRLGFARWLVSGHNPLTARVTVNRYWQKYFGTGIVKTSEDFGLQGEAPSHPGLLDWLATRFVESGWDVAGMQKLIVTSATYRQEAKVTPQLRRRDPANRLLARGPRVRLPGPVIRDQALFVSGLLVEKIGGPSVSPYQPDNLWIEMSMGTKYKLGKGDDLFRRSLYTVWKRTVNPPSMAVLDAADRESCWVGVKRTNTPLQALTLLNETAFVEAARHLAERMMREGGGDPVGFAFRAATARHPSERERAILEAALDEYEITYAGEPGAAGKLIATGTTPVPKDLDPAALAAHLTVANIILNLDEVITKE